MRVLIADDQKLVAAALADMVRSCHHEVVEVVSSGIDAIKAYQRTRPDVVLMDFSMTRLNGLTACRQILSSDPASRIIFISGYRSPDLDPTASGAVAVLQKPFGVEELRATFRAAERAGCDKVVAFNPVAETESRDVLQRAAG